MILYGKTYFNYRINIKKIFLEEIYLLNYSTKVYKNNAYYENEIILRLKGMGNKKINEFFSVHSL